IGFSMSVRNFNYDGQIGYQCSTSNGQTTGYYTSNASYFDGTEWTLFSFGADPVTGVANFVARIEGSACSPCPGDYNNDQGVDDLDIGAFFQPFERGASCADVDASGGIDDLDISAFFASFQEGC